MGHGVRALLAHRGHDVTLACRDPEQARAIAETGRNPRYLTHADLRGIAATTIEAAPSPTPSSSWSRCRAPRRDGRRAAPRRRAGPDPDEGARSGHGRAAVDARARPAGRRALRPEHRRGDRPRPAGRRRDRERGHAARARPAGCDQLGHLPRLRQRRRRRRRALRRGEERDRARRRRRRRPGARRQREGGARRARARRDGAARGGRGREARDVRRACGHGRPRRHLLVEVGPQPPRRRADRAGRTGGGARRSAWSSRG